MRKLFFISILTLISIVIHAQSCHDDNHPHAIDLGLPSGTKWACCNVGANAPMEYGDYFSGGETAQKDEYLWETYSYCHSDDGYHNIAAFEWDFLGEDIGGTQYDAAHVNWGGNWRMPNLSHIKELMEYCECESLPADSEIHGLILTGPNGQSILMPAGYSVSGELEQVFYGREGSSLGSYWTSSQCMDYDYYHDAGFEFFAYTFDFNATPEEYIYPGLEFFPDGDVCSFKFVGMNIRPILDTTSSADMLQNDVASSPRGIFTIQGTRACPDTNRPSQLPKGIYIVDGRKAVVR